jgi:hypothetical protein
MMEAGMVATVEPLKIAGICHRDDAGPDDPPYYVIFHRNVGGPQCLALHKMNDCNCWCSPLLVAPEDSRREVFQQQFEGMKRLN